MKKTIKFLFCTLLCMTMLFSMTGCSGTITVGSVEKSDNSGFSMKYAKFRGTKEYDVKLSAGDMVSVGIESESGELSLYIVKKGNDKKDAIYEGTDLSDSTFQVEIPEDGTYIFHFEADNHKGSYSVKY